MAAPAILKLVLLCTVTFVNAHTIMQRIAVNGVSEPNMVGIRAPFYNYPLFNAPGDIDSPDLACGRNHTYPFVGDVVNVPSGSEVGTFWWGHVIGSVCEKLSNLPSDIVQDVNFDPNQTGWDKPITTDHRGPLIYYLAKVDNATTASSDNLNWFKVGQEALTPPAHWGINSMMTNNGWTYFTLPACLAPGNYLLRTEALALHQAQYIGGAQFYVSCAQINVVGTGTWKGSNYQKFPGSYNASDPGILIDIYTWLSTGGGIANNKGRPYVAPGGDVQTCPGSTPTSTSTVIATTAKTPTSTIAAFTTKTSTSTATATATPTGPAAPIYGQCGGAGWTGATRCASGSCVQSNDYYSQCLP